MDHGADYREDSVLLQNQDSRRICRYDGDKQACG
jgi:hypothetical protein